MWEMFAGGIGMVIGAPESAEVVEFPVAFEEETTMIGAASTVGAWTVAAEVFFLP